MKNKKLIMITVMATCFMVGCGKDSSDVDKQSNESKLDIAYSQGATEGSNLSIELPNGVEVVNHYQDESQPQTREIEWKGTKYNVSYTLTSKSLARGIEHIYDSKDASIIIDDEDNLVNIVFNSEANKRTDVPKLQEDDYKKIAMDYIGDELDLKGYECDVEQYPYVSETTSVTFVRKINGVPVEDKVEILIDKWGEVSAYACINLHSFDNVSEEEILNSNILSDDVLEQAKKEITQKYEEKYEGEILVEFLEDTYFMSEDGKFTRDMLFNVTNLKDNKTNSVHAIVKVGE